MYGHSVREGLARCNQNHQPKREKQESSQTLQGIGLGRGEDRQRSEQDLGTGTDRDLLTQGSSKDVITSLLWGPRPRNPNSPETVIRRQNERRQPGTRP